MIDSVPGALKRLNQRCRRSCAHSEVKRLSMSEGHKGGDAAYIQPLGGGMLRPCLAKNSYAILTCRTVVSGHFEVLPKHGRRRSFSAMQGPSFPSTIHVLAVVPRQPLRGVGC